MRGRKWEETTVPDALASSSVETSGGHIRDKWGYRFLRDMAYSRGFEGLDCQARRNQKLRNAV